MNYPYPQARLYHLRFWEPRFGDAPPEEWPISLSYATEGKCWQKMHRRPGSVHFQLSHPPSAYMEPVPECVSCGRSVWYVGDTRDLDIPEDVVPGSVVAYPDPDGEEYTVCLECENDREKHFSWRRSVDKRSEP